MECAHERVAQSVEHVTFNHGVVGSIPTALTNKIKYSGRSLGSQAGRNAARGNGSGNAIARQPWEP